MSGAIPIRRDNWTPSPRDLSTTPGGTIYATTPGGTRIAYDRNALLYIRNSPLAKTPTNLPVIPGVTVADNVANEKPQPQSQSQPQSKPKNAAQEDSDAVFEME